MNVSESSSDEFFFEYFFNRPTLFMIYLTITIAIASFGSLLNFAIILVKLRNFKDLNGHDIFTINMAIGQIFIAIASITFLADEIHYRLTDHSWCGLKFYSYTLSMLLVGYTCLASLIISTCIEIPTKNQGIISVLIVWVLTATFGYPYIEVGLFSVPLKSEIEFKNICMIKVKSLEQLLTYRTWMTIAEYFTPCGLLILISIIAFKIKRKDILARKFLLYPMIMGFYFTISSAYVSLVDFFFIQFGITMNLPIYLIWKIFLSTISIANAVIYLWVDEIFFRRCLQFFKLSGGNVKISYVNVKNGKDDDLKNLTFESI